ncbi:MAG TPA: O-succinylhomoserine sulfhydrylase [Gammaproteobacteria bacterium]|nr:O-succinylhomoserine sulfhydrylase [Gammaproteobacteria bacterium]
MNTTKNQPYRPQTLAVRCGQHRTAEGEHSEALFLTSSFVFESAQQAAARFADEEPGNIYSRFANPTVSVFQERLAALEGAESCVATASGMAAILSLALTVLSAGDHVILSNALFGSTITIFRQILVRFGITFDVVSQTSTAAWRAAVKSNTKLLFAESPSNPLTEIADLAALAQIAHSAGALLAVDNTFCTPILQQPLQLGADVVIHSATKFLDGQGRCLGGAVLGSQELVGESVFKVLRNSGPCMSPFNAWVFIKGLETLTVRLQAACANALKLAQWLEQHPGVARVYYPGLQSHPQYALAGRQQSGAGSMLSFDIHGGKAVAWRLLNSLKLLSLTANLGDTKTTITHPSSTTHARWSEEDRQAAGIGQSLLRISLGLEDQLDLREDLDAGFQAAIG